MKGRWTYVQWESATKNRVVKKNVDGIGNRKHQVDCLGNIWVYTLGLGAAVKG